MDSMIEFTTTFREDFSIADRFSVSAIRDTYKRAFTEWKNDYRYLTDLVMGLNHKIWEWYGVAKGHPYVRVYDELWKQADDYAVSNLKGEELNYYFRITD